MFLLGFCLDRFFFFFSMHNIDSHSLELGTVSQFRGVLRLPRSGQRLFMFKNSMRIISGTKNHEAQEATLVDRGIRGFSLNCFTFMA